jgi:hypothetical protein
MKDLYVSLDGRRIELRKLDLKMGAEIWRGVTGNESVFEVKPEVWSAADNNLPAGIQAVYVSGAERTTPLNAQGSIQVVGELAQFRTDQAGQQKCYRSLLVGSGDNTLYYGSEFKNFPEHYYSGEHPTGDIWGRMHPVTRLAIKVYSGVSGLF